MRLTENDFGIELHKLTDLKAGFKGRVALYNTPFPFNFQNLLRWSFKLIKGVFLVKHTIIWPRNQPEVDQVELDIGKDNLAHSTALGKVRIRNAILWDFAWTHVVMESMRVVSLNAWVCGLAISYF